MPTARLNGVAVTSIAAGSLMMYAAITGKSVLSSLYAVVSGNNPSTVPPVYPIAGLPAGMNPASAMAAGNLGLPVAAPNGPITNSAQAKAYAFSLLPSYGWAGQESLLDKLWTQESSWDANAVNPSSGAYGIPQALPAAHGHPYQLGWGDAANQIRWGLNYIRDTYHSVTAAWAHEQTSNWY